LANREEFWDWAMPPICVYDLGQKQMKDKDAENSSDDDDGGRCQQ